jgi:allantoinase
LLWAALLDGTLDLIATDHSPCPPHMKRLDPIEPGEERGRFDEAWGGIASLSTALPVLWTECNARGTSLLQLTQWTSAAPSHLAGIGSLVGSIEPGKHANLVAFDTEAQYMVAADQLHYRHKISPYMGERLRGIVRSTWLRGTRVFDQRNGQPNFPAKPNGREYAISCSLS